MSFAGFVFSDKKAKALEGVLPVDGVISFEKNQMPESNSGCWLWLNRLNHKGYGVVLFRNGGKKTKSVAAHRFSFWMHKGNVPEGLLVLHSCDTPCCVNPEHLFLGTYLDNNRDCMRKGRHMSPAKLANKAVGEKINHSKLREADVVAIRKLRKIFNGIQLGKRYGVDSSCIYNIWKGKTWKHVK